MLRQIDRVFAPVVWVAAALTVVLLLAGPSLIGADADKTATAGSTAAAAPDGKAIFASNCSSCHTLARADATGNVGPNLDDLKPDAATVKATVNSGKGTMPAFKDTLSAAEIDAVAAFVAGDEPAAATPEPAEVTTADTAPGPDGVTVADDRVFVTNASAGSLQRFDASTGQAIGEPLAVGRQPDNPLVAGGAIWVALGGDDAVAKVEGSEVTRIPVGDAPEDLAVAGGSIWVTNAGDGTVTASTARPGGSPDRRSAWAHDRSGSRRVATRSGSRASTTAPSGASTPAPARGAASRSRSAPSRGAWRRAAARRGSPTRAATA